MMRLGDLLALEAVDVDELVKANLVDEQSALRITGIAADSRKVQRGNLFVAISGTHSDGAQFVPAAIESGAVAIMLDDDAVLDVALPAGLSVIRSANPRRALAMLAARFYPRQPGTIVAVTGTAGKTSVADFTAQIFKKSGLKAATIGTLGVVVDGQAKYGGLTTPDPVSLHQILDKLARDGVTHVALEASSHGLDQHRLDGVRLCAGAFTNLGRDHMDYHATEEEYFAAKARLMSELLPKGAPFIINQEAPWGVKAGEVAEAAQLRVLKIGEDIKVRDCTFSSNNGKLTQNLELEFFGHAEKVQLPLPGAFQVDNALTAAGLGIACKLDPLMILPTLEKLKGVPGRLEAVPMQGVAGQIFVDFAHKPEALESTLLALRPYTKRLLIVVFGAGGDRDSGKRPLMGAIANKLADVVIVTDDNPRNEDPLLVRKAILEAAPKAIEIGDRRSAIDRALAIMGPDDLVVVAGKGHEQGQIVGNNVQPFSDHEEISKALIAKKTPAIPKTPAKIEQGRDALWTYAELEAALDGRPTVGAPNSVYGISIDSRTTQPGDLFFAIKGERFDGHDYVRSAFRSGAALAVVSEDKLPALGQVTGPMLIVKDVLDALGRLGVAARARTSARIIAVTGSVGKTSTKEMLAIGLGSCGRVHASIKSFNNHWGVPLTLARMPANAEFGVFEIGMNHPGEIEPLVKMVRPHSAIITTVAPVHLEAFDNVAGIAAAKAEIFSGLEPGGTAILNRDNEFFDYLKEKAEKAWASNVLSFGNKKGVDGQLAKFTLVEHGCQIQAKIQNEGFTFSMPTSGRYLAENAMAVLLAAKDQGADVQKVSQALASYKLLDGRGASHRLGLQNGAYTLVDESYNANPASMKASIGLLGTIPSEGRKILVLGDMLELGDESAVLHSALIDAVDQANIDRVFLCGTMMTHLWEKLAASQKAHYSLTSSELMAPLLNEIQSGDVVMVKGSLGMSMNGIVNALKMIHSQPAAGDAAVTEDA